MSARNLAIAISASLAAYVANAATPAQDAASGTITIGASADGLMQFANVSVVSADKPESSTEVETDFASGARAFKDKDTGRLRSPTVEEMSEATMGPALRRSSVAPLVRRTLTNGMRAVELNESFNAYAVAVKSGDGTLQTECVESEDIAMAALAGTPAKDSNNDHQ